jgi:hypothetical protein
MQDYFWKVFRMYYNLICFFICTPICTIFFLFLQKVGVTQAPLVNASSPKSLAPALACVYAQRVIPSPRHDEHHISIVVDLLCTLA